MAAIDDDRAASGVDREARASDPTLPFQLPSTRRHAHGPSRSTASTHPPPGNNSQTAASLGHSTFTESARFPHSTLMIIGRLGNFKRPAHRRILQSSQAPASSSGVGGGSSADPPTVETTPGCGDRYNPMTRRELRRILHPPVSNARPPNPTGRESPAARDKNLAPALATGPLHRKPRASWHPAGWRLGGYRPVRALRSVSAH